VRILKSVNIKFVGYNLDIFEIIFFHCKHNPISMNHKKKPIVLKLRNYLSF